MSSNASRDYYHTHSSNAVPRSSRQTLPPLRSVLGEQLDLPVRSGSGSYDLGEMSRALQSSTVAGPEYRTSARSSSSMGTYADRDREHHGHHHDQRPYTFPPSAASAAAQSGHRSGHGQGYHVRPMTPTYEAQGYGYSSSSSAAGALSKTERGHSNKKYPCTWPGCDKRFERQNALDTHMNIHTEQKPYACPVPYCGKVFNVRSNMRRHLLTHKDYQAHAGGEPIDEDEFRIGEEDIGYFHPHSTSSSHTHNGRGSCGSGEHRRTSSASYYSSSRRT